MIQLSSQATFLYKTIPPAFLCGFIAMMGVGIVPSAIAKGDPFVIPFLAASAAVLCGFGYYVMKRYMLDLADGVWDDDTTLLVKRGRLKERVPLADVMDFRYDGVQNPSRVTLILRKSSAFGPEIAFVPTYRMDRQFPLETPPEILDLLDRADAARRNLTQDALGEQ